MRALEAARRSPVRVALRFDVDGRLWIYALHTHTVFRTLGDPIQEQCLYEQLELRDADQFDDWEAGQIKPRRVVFQTC